VKRLISYTLVMVFLLGSVIDLHDLSKLPYMIQHFQQHKNKSQAFSFEDFFELHYGQKAEQHDKQEHDEHEGLPFKTHDCTASHTSMMLPQVEAKSLSSFSLIIRYSNFYQSAYSSEFSQSIWQPPRLS